MGISIDTNTGYVDETIPGAMVVTDETTPNTPTYVDDTAITQALDDEMCPGPSPTPPPQPIPFGALFGETVLAQQSLMIHGETFLFGYAQSSGGALDSNSSMTQNTNPAAEVIGEGSPGTGGESAITGDSGGGGGPTIDSGSWTPVDASSTVPMTLSLGSCIWTTLSAGSDVIVILTANIVFPTPCSVGDLTGGQVAIGGLPFNPDATILFSGAAWGNTGTFDNAFSFVAQTGNVILSNTISFVECNTPSEQGAAENSDVQGVQLGFTIIYTM